ncbi:MAG: ferrous iron transport protein B [Candidatus Aminicenantes bacterium]|nr:ferrous iron transport protein B [Candidatus Aminicenantes bacterium]
MIFLNRKQNIPDIVFIGQPNCGKSTLFNSIAGLKAVTSNFPGTTVKHTHSKVNVQGRLFNIIDLPGTYSLNPADEAEKVALTHLFIEKPDLVINVVDASILGRSLEMTMELMELDYPMVLALNMMDLAEKKGIDIDPEKLEKKLGIPVIPTVASHGKGVKQLLDETIFCLDEGLKPQQLSWSKDVEDQIKYVQEVIPDEFKKVANDRFTAIKSIELDRLSFNRMLDEISPSLKQRIMEARRRLRNGHGVPAYEVIAAERHHLAHKLFEDCCCVTRRKKSSLSERIDDVIMHPFWGYFILMGVFLSFFSIIFLVASPVEEWLLGPLTMLRESLPDLLGSGGLFYVADGIIQGIAGGIAIVLPYFIPLLILMSLLEDIGYLSRVGFLMDTLMHKIGLHGKSVTPFMLGLGCNVPAVVSTRILESRRDKIMTTLLIPFIPCSARTTIILALVAFYLGPVWAVGFYFFNMLLVAVLGRALSLFFKRPSPGLILEIPSLKIPSLPNMMRKVYFQLKSFIEFAWPLLIAGSMVLGLLQFFHIDRMINTVLSPVMQHVLGLPEELGVTLIFGFLRKELSLIMMLQALGVHYDQILSVVSPQQIMVFTVFLNFFIPCLSTVAIIWKEIGRKWALVSIALNTSVALVISFIARLIFIGI